VDSGLPAPVVQRLPPTERYELRIVLLIIAISLVGIPFGLLLQQVSSGGPLTSFDEGGAQWLNDRVSGHDALIKAMEVVSFTGKPIFLVFAIGIPAVWLFLHGSRKLTLFLAITCIGGGIVDTIVKVMVARPRPEVDNPIIHAFGKSFPSGHSMQAVVCYGALLLVMLPLIHERWRRPAVGLTVMWILLIGASRMSLGVHFLTDVLGGYVLGAAWLIASVAAFEIWREDRGRRRTRPLEEGIEPEEAKVVAPA
jgi:undecaprenyl-diphosphatase